MEPKAFCDMIAAQFEEMTRTLNISNDGFIRTTEPRHYESTRAIWRKLVEAGDIYLGSYAGWYSVRDEAYFSEDELVRDGDRWLTPGGAEVEWIEEPSYFFRFSAYTDRLIAHYEANPGFAAPPHRRNELMNFLRQGLKDLSVSRTSFNWGVPVPDDDDHIVYVWLDALTNYITAAGYPHEESEFYRRYWPADIHIVGKDIMRFHAIYWPAFLMSAGVPLPGQVFGHGFLTIEGQKMSKSVGNVVTPDAMRETYGVDQMRYFLMREVPYGNDGSVTPEAIVQRINSRPGERPGQSRPARAHHDRAQLRRTGAGTGRIHSGRRSAVRRRGCAGEGHAGCHGRPGDPPDARGDLARRRRRQPLCRRPGALGPAQDRSGAHGDGALRPGRRDPAVGDLRAARGAGRCAARCSSSSRCRRRRAPATLPPSPGGSRRARRCRRPGRCSRASSPKTRPEPAAGDARRCWSTATATWISTPWPEDRAAVLDRAWRAGIETIVTICTRMSRFGDILAIAAEHKRVFCSVGVHPHNADEEGIDNAAQLVEKPNIPRLSGSARPGGLFLHEQSSRNQRASFLAHIAAARETGLPLIVHARDADAETMEILTAEREKGAFPGVIHCFTGSRALAERAVALGLYISFSCILTFRKADDLRAIARDLPEDRILVETAAPFLAPVPHRGRTNEPSFVVHTAECLATVRDMPVERLQQATTDNFYRLFNKISRQAPVTST